jgi:hypothetical protein
LRRVAPTLALLLAACGSGPTGGELAITPSDPTTVLDLVAEVVTDATASNPRLPVTYSWSWWKDGERQPGFEEPTLASTNTARGEEWSVQAIPFDGRRHGEPLIASVVIANAQPTAIVTISPLAPTSSQDLTASAAGADPDGDEVELRYLWSRNGATVQSATGPTVPASLTRRAQKWKVQVLPFDGDLQGRAAEAEVTIRNSPPAGAELEIVPADPVPSSALFCDVTTPAVDPDDDPVTYTFAWTRNGATWTGATARTVHDRDTIPSRTAAEGEIWACSATASDGEATGPTATSVSVTILPDPVAVYTFVDTSAIDVSATSLRDFFQANPASSTDYLFFEVKGGSSGGAWCAQRADWYASNYVSLAGGSSTVTSGSWQKWHRAASSGWSGPVTSAHANYFGSGCASSAWNWCSEWGIGGRYLGVMPGRAGGESYASTFSSGSGWEFTLKIAKTRLDACGF